MDVDTSSRLSVPANSLEHEFASKTTLVRADSFKDKSASDTTSPGDWISQMDEEYLLRFKDVPDDNGIEDRVLYVRSVIENGQKVEKPAYQWLISLKDGPPEGCTPMAYHLDILKQVVGSDASEVYEGFGCDTLFETILTAEEKDKLCGLTQVQSVMDTVNMF